MTRKRERWARGFAKIIRQPPSAPILKSHRKAMVYKQTDRERQRYVTYQGPEPIDTFQKLFGTVGIASAGLQRRSKGVIRTNAQSVDRLRTAIALTPGARTVKVTTSFNGAKALAQKTK